MELDTNAIREALEGVPASLGELKQLLAPSVQGPRPWLPPLPDVTPEHVELWLEVVEAVAPSRRSEALDERLDALHVFARCPIPPAATDSLPVPVDPVQIPVTLDVLARSGWDGAREALENHLNHADPTVRWRAAGNLGPLGEKAAIAGLRAVLARPDEDPLVLRWAAESLGDLGGAAEQRLLELLATRWDHTIALDGVRGGLRALGVEASTVGLPTELTTPLQMLEAGEGEGLGALLDLWNDPLLGASVRMALLVTSGDELRGLGTVLREGPVSRQFAAADLAGLRGMGEHADALEALSTHPNPALTLVGATGLLRLDRWEAGPALAERWIANFEHLDRLHEGRRALLLESPLPEEIVTLLVDDPCAMVTALGAELLRRHPTKAHRAQLLAALSREHDRLVGAGEARPAIENDRWVMSEDRLRELVEAGESIRRFLPDSVQGPARALEEVSVRDPHVIAARALLHALKGYPAEVSAAVLPGWLQSLWPQLRLDALSLWAAQFGTLPEPSLVEDDEPAIAALWEALSG